MRILVVDDSEDGRDVAEAMLLAAGYQDVSTAGSAAEAYRFLAIGEADALEPSPVDLVLLDIMMPELDGFAVLDWVRKNERLRKLPVIILTAKDLTAAELGYLRGHGGVVIPKGPSARETLLAALRKSA